MKLPIAMPPALLVLLLVASTSAVAAPQAPDAAPFAPAVPAPVPPSVLTISAAPVGLAATPLDQAYRAMYNLDFVSAHRILRQYEAAQPADPMAPVSDAAAYLFAEFDRLHILESEFFTENEDGFHKREKTLLPDPIAAQDFEAALIRSDRASAAALRRNPADENALLATLFRTGLHTDYLGFIQKRNMAALSEMKQGRVLAETLLAKYQQLYDAYLAIGVENYMLSLAPAPIRWFLRLSGAQTDRQVGLERLRVTAEKGHYLLPYARMLLAVVAIRDKDNTNARQILSALSAEFPGNLLYRRELAKLN